jgi:hypothetical protein
LASSPKSLAAATDLISFLKALPDCWMRRGVRFPQWWLLLVAILAILSGQGSLLGMDRFPIRHRKTHNELHGTHIGKPPSDPTFRLLLAQLDVEGFERLLQAWMISQNGDCESVDTLVCVCNTPRGSIAENASGAARFIAQSIYATDCGSEIKALREVLDRAACEPPFRLPRAALRRLPDPGELMLPQGTPGDS